MNNLRGRYEVIHPLHLSERSPKLYNCEELCKMMLAGYGAMQAHAYELRNNKVYQVWNMVFSQYRKRNNNYYIVFHPGCTCT